MVAALRDTADISQRNTRGPQVDRSANRFLDDHLVECSALPWPKTRVEKHCVCVREDPTSAATLSR
jgi:hypothetical protein